MANIETITIRKQTPHEGMWLYRLIDNQYILTKCAYLGKEDTEWQECTDEQKATFEAHNAALDAEMEADMNKELEAEQ